MSTMPKSKGIRKHRKQLIVTQSEEQFSLEKARLDAIAACQVGNDLDLNRRLILKTVEVCRKAEALDLREQLTEQDVGNENHPKLIELRQTTHAFFLMRKRVVGKVEKKKKLSRKYMSEWTVANHAEFRVQVFLKYYLNKKTYRSFTHREPRLKRLETERERECQRYRFEEAGRPELWGKRSRRIPRIRAKIDTNDAVVKRFQAGLETVAKINRAQDEPIEVWINDHFKSLQDLAGINLLVRLECVGQYGYLDLFEQWLEYAEKTKKVKRAMQEDKIKTLRDKVRNPIIICITSVVNYTGHWTRRFAGARTWPRSS